MFFFLKILIGLIAILVIAGVLRTWAMEYSPRELAFAEGRVPQPDMDGFYKGNVRGYKGAWLGKKFDAAHASGINVFQEGAAHIEKYPFKTSVDTGVHDALQVLKIDYNIPSNPFWVRPILDEVVQTGKEAYLGKLQLRIIPGYPFTLAFFELEK